MGLQWDHVAHWQLLPVTHGIEPLTSGSPDTQNGKLNSSATEPLKSTVYLLTLLLTKLSSHSTRLQ